MRVRVRVRVRISVEVFQLDLLLRDLVGALPTRLGRRVRARVGALALLRRGALEPLVEVLGLSGRCVSQSVSKQ